LREVFVSDFDGTITNRDFYWIVIDKYLDESVKELYIKWQDGKMRDIEFLSYVFGNINQPLDVIKRDILSIPIDDTAIKFIDYFTKNRGDFYILSAGCDFYINLLLEELNLKNSVKVISNFSYFEDGNIILKPDNTLPYYSDIYGIDKGKAIDNIRENYDFIYFAGDSRPDILASKNADMVFAKSKLIDFLKAESIEHFAFESFANIEKYIKVNKI
jgi:2,3-diketo-5-methylthio-1-phosphopentane phosphatase